LEGICQEWIDYLGNTATDYLRISPDLPNHTPRGCPRGASYSWYVYLAQRVKYPMIRGRLMEVWQEARKTMGPIQAWESISQDPVKAKRFKSVRGLGSFANAFTVKKFDPNRVVGFSPIPAMSCDNQLNRVEAALQKNYFGAAGRNFRLFDEFLESHFVLKILFLAIEKATGFDRWACTFYVHARNAL
jgi:hypothetical protein